MEWTVSYNTIKHGRVVFNEDEDINCPTYMPEGTTPEEAIESVKDYLIEVYGCNCFSSRAIENGIEMFDPFDGEKLEAYTDFSATRFYTLIDEHGRPYKSITPGVLGGHRKLKIYGRLDCPSANRALAKGQYKQYRVFFKNEQTATAAGYRPCARCLHEEYKRWKSTVKDKC